MRVCHAWKHASSKQAITFTIANNDNGENSNMAIGEGAAATSMAIGVRIDYPIRLSTSQLPKFELHRTNQLSAVDPVSSNKENGERSSQTWKIKMLYDGDCPLCMSEVNVLRERNRRYGTIKFVDISSDGYTSEENEGLDYRTVMRRIHAILADGTVVRDVVAFKRLYEQVGLGWEYAVTKYEPVGTMADVVYGLWAKYCLQWTGET